jgi:2-oxoglutarate dehydrogenase E2 component (dihydrolipoamide succinyltransferase)
MPIEKVKVPQAGESITEATVNRWLKPDGASVAVDEPLVELGTDKATQEVPAPAAGVLKIIVPEGKTVTVGTVVAEIDTEASGGRKPPESEKASGGSQPPESEKASGGGKPPESEKASGPPESEKRQTAAPSPGPAATRLLNEAGLTPAQVAGTGPGGRVTKGDVLETSGGRQPPDPALKPEANAARSPNRVTRQPMSQIRKRIAERLVESQNRTATLTTFNEADMSAIGALRATYNEKFEKKHGVKLGFMSLFVKAAVEALKAYPLVNARIDGADIVYQHFYDIGVAVSTEKGLMVPILRDADRLGLAAIEKAIAEIAKKAREGKIAVTDLEGGTFTITNGGIFGSMLSTPILNPPQSAILGMHNITKRPVVINDEIAIRPIMYLALSYDHRIVDGREAVQFLVRIKECVENPERMLLEI